MECSSLHQYANESTRSWEITADEQRFQQAVFLGFCFDNNPSRSLLGFLPDYGDDSDVRR